MSKEDTTFMLEDKVFHAYPTLDHFIKDSGFSNANKIKKIKLHLEKDAIDDISQLYGYTLHDFMQQGLTKPVAKKLVRHLMVIKKRSKLILKGDDLRGYFSNFKYLSTGISEIDKVFTYSDGHQGLRSKTVVELYGPAGCGKTQMAIILAIRSLLPLDLGGWDRSVLYIDSENAFDYHRFEELAKFYKLPETSLTNLLHSKVDNFDELEEVLYEIGKELRTKDLGMIIVDSIIDPLKSQYPLDDELTNLQQRQQHLKIVMDRLKSISQIHDLIVVYTNQVRSAMDENNPNRVVPQGGNVLSHASDIRCSMNLINNSDDDYTSKILKNLENLSLGELKVVDCGFLPTTSSNYILGPFGIGGLTMLDRFKKITKEYLKYGLFPKNINMEEMNTNEIEDLKSDIEELRDKLY